MVNSSCLVNVVYSSDGSDNRVDIRLDLDTVSSFTTQSPTADIAPNEQWNKLRNSGRVGDNKHLQQGIHYVTLTAYRTSCSGVEIGTISLNILCDPEFSTPSASTGIVPSAPIGITPSASDPGNPSRSDTTVIIVAAVLVTSFIIILLVTCGGIFMACCYM